MKKGQQYPSLWVTGPDPETHRRYRQFIQQRNQAQWRGETWLLTFAEWLAIWGDQYHRRGRERDCICMSRCDWDGPWSVSNTELITREDHARRQADHRAAGWSSVARQRQREAI